MNDVGCVPELARKILVNFPRLEKQAAFQDILFQEQVGREKILETKQSCPFILCDRGSLDIIAYSKLFGHSLKQEWVEWTKTYQGILLLD